MLVINLRNVGESVVLQCVGRIVAGEEVATLKRIVLSQVTPKAIVLDLSGVEFVDGAGMGALVFVQGWTQATGIRLQLHNPTRHIRELFELTNLDSVFEICPSNDLEKAIDRATLAMRTDSGISLPCAHH